jgi:hypothetical protein
MVYGNGLESATVMGGIWSLSRLTMPTILKMVLLRDFSIARRTLGTSACGPISARVDRAIDWDRTYHSRSWERTWSRLGSSIPNRHPRRLWRRSMTCAGASRRTGGRSDPVLHRSLPPKTCGAPLPWVLTDGWCRVRGPERRCADLSAFRGRGHRWPAT